MNRELILKIITEFYAIATKDILIGFHFRHIDDFDVHLSKISVFWEIQINGHSTFPLSEPFNLFEAHRPLKFTPGQLKRWVILFQENLDRFVLKQEISIEEKENWMNKVRFFEERLFRLFFGTSTNGP